MPGGTFSELRLRGLDLTVERAADGFWSVRGLPGQQQEGGDPFAALERLGELQIIGGRLHVVAPTLGIDATVPRIDLRLRVEGTASAAACARGCGRTSRRSTPRSTSIASSATAMPTPVR